MFSFRHPAQAHRLATWLACFAILFGSLAPSFAQALERPDSSGRWSEICTTLGVKLVKLDATHGGDRSLSEQPGAHGPLGEHCLYCQLNSAPGLPPPDSPAPLVAVSVQRVPPLFYHSPRPLFTWTSAHPRAPPVLS